MSASLVNRFFNDVISGKNMKVLDEILHPALHTHHLPPNSDRAGFIEAVRGFISGFPDITITVHQQYEKGDRVFSYLSWMGTHNGPFQGIPPTHKKVTVEFMDIWRIEEGKLRETWVIMDFMGLMVQLGAVPAPAGK